MRLKGETSVLFIARTRTKVTIVRSSENSQEKWDRVLNSRVPDVSTATQPDTRDAPTRPIALYWSTYEEPAIDHWTLVNQSDTWGHRVNPDRIYILRWSSFSNIYMNVCSKAVLDCWLNSGLSYFTIENYFLRLLGHDTVSERKEKNTHLNETIDAKFNILMRSPCWVNRERLTAIINWFYRFFFCRNVSAL